VHRLVSVLLLTAWGAFGQNGCEAPLPNSTAKVATIFSPEQEEMLGDVIAETLQREFRVYPQQDLTEPLERIAARLHQSVPTTRIISGST